MTDSVIESFYLETTESLFFAVKGFTHPPDRYTAFLRYHPDPKLAAPLAGRQKNGVTYRRLYHFPEQEAYLEQHHPEYLVLDPVLQMRVQSVRRDRVARVHDPRQRLEELRQSPARDALEQDVLDFATQLAQHARVPPGSLGVSGSVLIGLHTPDSDIDLTVHGLIPCRAVHQALQELLARPDGQIQRLDPAQTRELYAARQADTRMDYDDFRAAERQKVNQGRFRQRTYFIRFLKDAAEAGEVYGDRSYQHLGRARIEATIAGDSEAIFTPCRYALAGVVSLSGAPGPEIREVVSYRGRFCEQARAGETVWVEGMVEEVCTLDGQTWRRVVLGNDPEDTMIVKR